MLEAILESSYGFNWSFQVLGWLGLFAAASASVHVILKKRDSRSAIAWMGLIWLSPFVGVFLYLIFGVNRLRRKAQAIRPRTEYRRTREILGANVPIEAANQLCLGDVVTATPAVAGNAVQLLLNGDEAYPLMLKAIEQARDTITLATYIFDYDALGLRFADALEAAMRRGVQVRVLIDDVGSRYSKPRMTRELKRRGIHVARFLPVFSPRSFFFLNLRLHRKILVVDGRLAYTGGMNIRGMAIRDTHFEVRGPVVADIQQVFANDWLLSTGEMLRGGSWFPPLAEEGPVLARCVDDGPDLHLENARWILRGAIAGARRRMRIVTPYFVPDVTLITALNTAAMRGVKVQILLPAENNLPWVQWASFGTVWQVLERGCEVYLMPPPFDHSKLMTVDEQWTFFGSVNWDERSLRLNFELNLEAFDTTFAKKIDDHIDERIAVSRRLTLEELENRGFSVRLRDGFARLFSPYL